MSARIGKLLATGLLCCLTAAAAAAPASASFDILDFDGYTGDAAGAPYTQAGGHPHDLYTKVETTGTTDSIGRPIPDGSPKSIAVEAPPGLVGNPQALSRCREAELAADECESETQLGFIELVASDGSKTAGYPLYNMVPATGEPARFGFNIEEIVWVHLVPRLRDEGDYGITVLSEGISQLVPLRGAGATFWGVPADPAHDSLRTCHPDPGFGCSSALSERAFLSLPTSCTGPPTWTARAESWQQQDVFHTASFLGHDNLGNPIGNSGCDALDFKPAIAVEQSTDQAETESGLDFELRLPPGGNLDPEGVAEAQVKKATVTLPEGVTLNPSAAEGLGTCSEAELAAERYDSEPGDGCPNDSRLGSVEIQTPLLEERLGGSLYLAEPYRNRFGSLIAIYVVARNAQRGVVVRLAGRVEPDPETGRLVTTFDDLPQLPATSFHLKFREGARAPLVSPPACGTYTVDASFVPWSAADPDHPTAAEVAEVQSRFAVTRGVGGGPCPAGDVPPFGPGFAAGSLNNGAGAYSPFYMRLTRRDGDQDMTRFSAVLPPGVAGKIAGIPRCPEAAIAAAQANTGKREQASPSCPAASRVGSTLAGAGVGSVLTYVPGSLYLAGPYNGAPLSVVAITPAVAGPFDVGTVVVREGLALNPKTARVEVDGAASDPIPHILAGIPLKVRDLRVYVDRPEFTVNPTSCDPAASEATLFGGYRDVFSSADDVPLGLTARYQAAGCSALKFTPKLALRLKGGVKRGAHPALRAAVKTRPGQANFSRAVVTLPRSAFLDQAHIRTICTRVQFAAGPGHGALCPPAARYGYARAWSPLLDGPAQGPVYLRSSDNKLPDLVVALTGPPSAPVQVELSSRIDSVKGGIRSTFTGIPDLPVSRFVLSMQGGKKGLIVNSRHLCLKPGKNRAKANLAGQNGKLSRTRPRVVAEKCAKRGGGKGKRAGSSRAGVSRTSALG